MLTPFSEALKDNGYHGIFEALFKVAHTEKQAYLFAKNLNGKTKAEASLATCSDVLRMTIRAGAGKLKKKTVKAVIEHVTQLLPTSNGEYCAGLNQFYLKVLGTLLEHEPHVEHLDEDDWTATVDFCLHGISDFSREGRGEDQLSNGTPTSLPYQGSSSGRASTTKLSVRSAGNRNSANAVTRKNSEELLECLLYLVSANNAPIIERAEEIIQGIMQFLRSHGFLVNPIHQVAFSALNVTLSSMNTDRTSLTQSLAPDLIPIIGRLWSSKSLSKDEMLNSVKDEMMVTLLQLRLHMERFVIDNSAKGFQKDVEELETILRNDYGKRVDRDQLQLDDLDLGSFSSEEFESKASIRMGSLKLRNHAIRAERKWAILKSLCVLDELLHVRVPPLSEDEEGNAIDDSIHPRKRRRIAQRYDGFAMRLGSQEAGERLAALQTIIFMLPDQSLSKEALGDLLNLLLSCIADQRGEICSWALLAIAL
jgi:ataxia telangiectasia mutated family protein